MSQYVFPVSSNLHCQVGWDVPLQTFYGRVYAVDDSGEQVVDENIVWVGTMPDAIRTVNDLQLALYHELVFAKPQLQERAVIPKDIYHELYVTEID